MIARSVVIRVLLAEKVLQHAVITWAFATDQAELREEASLDYRWFLVSGGLVGVLILFALVGHIRHAGWSTPLYTGLAAFDIAGEFVFQGGPGIVITTSLIVATVLVVLGIGEMRRNKARPSMPAGAG